MPEPTTVVELAGEHQHWCHGDAHAKCCGADDCDCGVTDRRDAIAAALADARAEADQLRDAMRALAEELDGLAQRYETEARGLIGPLARGGAHRRTAARLRAIADGVRR